MWIGSRSVRGNGKWDLVSGHVRGGVQNSLWVWKVMWSVEHG